MILRPRRCRLQGWEGLGGRQRVSRREVGRDAALTFGPRPTAGRRPRFQPGGSRQQALCWPRARGDPPRGCLPPAGPTADALRGRFPRRPRPPPSTPPGRLPPLLPAAHFYRQGRPRSNDNYARKDGSELAAALGVLEGQVMRILGATYGFTNAWRVFYLLSTRTDRGWI